METKQLARSSLKVLADIVTRSRVMPMDLGLPGKVLLQRDLAFGGRSNEFN